MRLLEADDVDELPSYLRQQDQDPTSVGFGQRLIWLALVQFAYGDWTWIKLVYSYQSWDDKGGVEDRVREGEKGREVGKGKQNLTNSSFANLRVGMLPVTTHGWH